jgi:hypothetical protein
MGLLLFLVVLAAIGGIWYGCSALQYKLSRKPASNVGWKTFGNILLLVMGPIAVAAFSLFLITQFDLISDQSGQGFGWLYVIYFMMQIIVVPVKVIYLTVFHFVVKKKGEKMMNDDHIKNI